MYWLLVLSIPWWNGMVINWYKTRKGSWSDDWHREGLLTRGLLFLMAILVFVPERYGVIAEAIINPAMLMGDLFGFMFTVVASLWLMKYGYDWIIAKMLNVDRWTTYRGDGDYIGIIETYFMFIVLGVAIFLLLVGVLYGNSVFGHIGWR